MRFVAIEIVVVIVVLIAVASIAVVEAIGLVATAIVKTTGASATVAAICWLARVVSVFIKVASELVRVIESIEVLAEL